MASFSNGLLQALFMLKLMLLFLCSTHAIELDVSVQKLHFKINEIFLVNKKACRIPSMSTSFELPADRSQMVDLDALDKWLQISAQNVNIDDSILQEGSKMGTQREDTEEIRERSGRQLQKTKSTPSIVALKRNTYLSEKPWSACIIYDPAQRRECCRELVERIGLKGKFGLNVCSYLVKRYIKLLLDQGVILKKADEDALNDELKRVVAKVSTSPGKTSSSMEPSIETNGGRNKRKKGNKGTKKAKNKPKQANNEGKKARKQEQLANFLANMKKIEENILDQKGGSLPRAYRDKYYDFMEAFERCYRVEKTAVFYHLVKQRWITCGPVHFKKSFAVYCADLTSVDPTAKELMRKPILRWESGSSEKVRDYLESISPIRTLTLTFHKNRDDGDIQVDGVAIRSDYVTVDLFGDYCSAVDLDYSCYAMCCDTYFESSYVCQSGSQCVG